MSGRHIRLIVAALALVTCTWIGQSRMTADDKAPNDGKVVLEIKGYAVAGRRVAICPMVPGYVVRLNVQEGQQVRAGEVLAKLDSAEQEVALNIARAEMKSAEMRFEQAKSGVGSGLGAAQAEIEIAKGKVELAQIRLMRTEVRAPFDATVISIRAELGALVDVRAVHGAVGSICELADLQVMEVAVDVPERDVAMVRAGVQCRVRLDAFPDQAFAGELTRVLPLADRAKGTISARIRFPVPAGGPKVLPGLTAIVQFLAP